MKKILRFVSALETMGNDYLPTDEFLSRNTELDLTETERVFDEWYQKLAERSSFEEANEASDAILPYLGASNQFYHENGIRWGIKLMIEVMAGSRTLEEISKML